MSVDDYFGLMLLIFIVGAQIASWKATMRTATATEDAAETLRDVLVELRRLNQHR